VGKAKSKPYVFAGSASVGLAKEICKYLKVPPGGLETKHFSDGETWIKINENVRGSDVYVIQSTSTPANENLMELLLIIDALRRASAEKINAVIPYYGYARQDRKDQGRVALSAKLVANLINIAGANRVITIDLHSGQIQGFFDIPVDHLQAKPILVDYVKGLHLKDYVVISPDVGYVKRARQFAADLNAPLAIVDKRRTGHNVSEVMNIIGDIEGKHAFIFDDLIDTAGTICNAAVALIQQGAKDVYVCCTHPVFSGDAFERISKAPLKKIIVTNTVSLRPKFKELKNLVVLSVAPLMGEVIKRIHNHQSVSVLFNEKL